MSYTNILLYGAATPQYDDEQQPAFDAKKDANNPDNFKNDYSEEEEKVKDL